MQVSFSRERCDNLRLALAPPNTARPSKKLVDNENRKKYYSCLFILNRSLKSAVPLG